MQQEIPSPTASRRGRSRTRFAAGTLALTMGTLGAGLAVTALPAYAQVTSNPYTIGTPTGGVSSVTASPTSVSSGAATGFSVTFTTPSALAGSSSSWISITPSVALGTAPTSLALVAGSCIQGTTSGTGGAGTSTTTSLVIYLASSCSIPAGTSVSVQFNANAPASGSFTFGVTTSANATSATSNTITVGAGASLSAASHNFGANTTYSISNVPVAGLSASTTSVTLSAAPSGGSGTIAFSTGTAGYTVTYTPSGGTAANDTVTSVSPSTAGPTVTLTLATAIANGGKLNIVATGTNPASGTATSNTVTVTPSGGTAQTAGSITFGNSVTNVTVSPSTPVASALATYTVTFKASSAVPVGGDIFLSETTGPTNFSTVTGIAVADANQNWRFVASGASLGNGTATIPLANAINAGDSITITLANVTNPATAQTVSNFLVSTTSDSVATAAPPYTIGANGSAGIVVTPNPNTVGSLSTYTISNLKASANMTGGSSTIGLTVNGPAGTVFPNNASSYSVADSTTGSGSGTATAVTGGGTSSVTITVPNNITSGDTLSLTIQNVINPSTPSSSYTITLTGNVGGPAPVAAFPNANVSYPNGAIISYNGTHYVFAGGRAFGISSPSQLASLQKVNHAVIQNAPTGATPPTGVTPRSGTLMFTRPINGNATIYVVGTDGELHGFATPKQFGDGGYNGALVVTVTNLGGLTVGDTVGAGGTALNALGTSADGAIVNSSGAYFVFAGGRAFGVPNPTTLNDIRKVNKAQTLTGTVTSAQKSASFASGALISVLGPVYVGYTGKIWPFRTQTQLKNLGYGGTAAVTVPNTGGLTIAS